MVVTLSILVVVLIVMVARAYQALGETNNQIKGLKDDIYLIYRMLEDV